MVHAFVHRVILASIVVNCARMAHLARIVHRSVIVKMVLHVHQKPDNVNVHRDGLDNSVIGRAATIHMVYSVVNSVLAKMEALVTQLTVRFFFSTNFCMPFFSELSESCILFLSGS